MPRHQQVIRQWRLLRRLEAPGSGLQVSEIAAQEGISPRTIYRDLEALQQAGFPLYDERDEHGRKRWRITAAFRASRGIPLSASEILALCCARSLLEGIVGAPFQAALQGLMAKLDAQLTPAMRDLACTLGQAFVGDPAGSLYAAAPSSILEPVQQAVASSRTLEITYRDPHGKETLRAFDPYNIWTHRGALYLVGWCHLRLDIRILALIRVRHAALTDHPFTIDPGYDFDALVAGRFRIMAEGKATAVRIRFSREVAAYILERTWHPSQTVRRLPGGSVELGMEVDGLAELRSWILGFGPNARVLSPPELARRVARDLRRALESYGDEGDPAGEKEDPV